ncbi:MAG: hypothetical protein B6U75_03895 [Desulfurococcales archaeon ex4484_217_1]|nr:MAG: hypothetical protein B6U75_03895 [Desulfurococcales archaeon ex4484_217_1]
MSELKISSDIEQKSPLLKDPLFKAKLATFGEYEGFIRGRAKEIIKNLLDKASRETCYHFKISLKKGSVWDEYEILTCKGSIQMILARINGKEVFGKNAFKAFQKIPSGPYIQAIMEVTKIEEKVLTGLLKPVPRVAVAKPVEETKLPPVETPPPSVSREIASRILPSILNKEQDIRKLATVYTEVYGYRFRNLRIRLAEDVIELLMELRSTSSSWIRPEEMIKKLTYRHIGPRLDKWAKTKVPLKLVLLVDGKKLELAR